MSPWLYLAGSACLAIGSKLPLAIAMFKHGGGRYDNQTPRDQQAELDGWGARARAAHYNTLEAFPFFAAGFLAAQLGGGEPSWIHILCITWFIGRVAYIWAYLQNLGTFRTTVWGISFFASIGLMLLPMLSG